MICGKGGGDFGLFFAVNKRRNGGNWERKNKELRIMNGELAAG